MIAPLGNEMNAIRTGRLGRSGGQRAAGQHRFQQRQAHRTADALAEPFADSVACSWLFSFASLLAERIALGDRGHEGREAVILGFDLLHYLIDRTAVLHVQVLARGRMSAFFRSGSGRTRLAACRALWPGRGGR